MVGEEGLLWCEGITWPTGCLNSEYAQKDNCFRSWYHPEVPASQRLMSTVCRMWWESLQNNCQHLSWGAVCVPGTATVWIGLFLGDGTWNRNVYQCATPNHYHIVCSQITAPSRTTISSWCIPAAGPHHLVISHFISLQVDRLPLLLCLARNVIVVLRHSVFWAVVGTPNWWQHLSALSRDWPHIPTQTTKHQELSMSIFSVCVPLDSETDIDLCSLSYKSGTKKFRQCHCYLGWDISLHFTSWPNRLISWWLLGMPPHPVGTGLFPSPLPSLDTHLWLLDDP